MLWLHLARSGKHYGKHSAEELYEICQNWPIKQVNTARWENEDDRHLEDLLPQTLEEAEVLYAEFKEGDFAGGGDAEGDAFQHGAEAAKAAFANVTGISKEIQDLVLLAAQGAAEKAFNLQASVTGKAAGANPSTSAVALARQHGAEALGPDMCIVSKQLLAGIVDAMERAREQFESAKHFFDGGKQHFSREVGRFDDALKYLRMAQKRAEGDESERGGRSRASGSTDRGPIGARGQSVVVYRTAYQPARTPPRHQARGGPERPRSRSRGRSGRQY